MKTKPRIYVKVIWETKKSESHNARKDLFTALIWTELEWPATTRPILHPYTMRLLVMRISVTTWLAAAKLGRLVPSQFVRCKHSQLAYTRWELEFSSDQFMCCEQTFKTLWSETLATSKALDHNKWYRYASKQWEHNLHHSSTFSRRHP